MSDRDNLPFVNQESTWSLNGTVALIRESTLQLLKYSLDLCVSQSIFLRIFRSQNGFVKTLIFLTSNYTIDYLIDYLIDYHMNYIIIT